MPKLIITRGISGSGKSTWARAQFGYVVISRDDIRASLFGSDGPEYYSVPKEALKANEDLVSKVEQAAVKSALLAGRNVISDNTYTMMKYVNQMAQVGWSVGAEVELKVFDVPLDMAILRVKARSKKDGGRDVPVEAIKRQHDQLVGSKNHKLIKPTPPTPYNGTPGKPKAFLFDLDGTTFHMGNKRSPYAHNVDVDDPDEVVLDIVRRFIDTGLVAVAMSGREEITRGLTVKALSDNGVEPDALFMRANKDMRKDSVIKAELFDKYVRDNYDVQFVLDDRNQVVEMWRQMGIKCLQVEDGNF